MYAKKKWCLPCQFFFTTTWILQTLANDTHLTAKMRNRCSQKKNPKKLSYHNTDPIFQSCSAKRLLNNIMNKYRLRIWFLMWNYEFKHGLLVCTILFCVGNRKPSSSIGCSHSIRVWTTNYFLLISYITHGWSENSLMRVEPKHPLYNKGYGLP